MHLRNCQHCEVADCIAPRIPREGFDAVLANPTGEYCIVGRVGEEVWKLIAKPVNAKSRWRFRLREAISRAFPHLFAPASFDDKALIVRQPFIPGRTATYSDSVAAHEAVHAAGLQMVVDVSPANVIVTNDGRHVIVDFGLDYAFHQQLRAQYGIAFGDTAVAAGSKG